MGMKGYKAFHKGLICRGKQYAENTVFEEKGADACCEAGVMHFCEEPLAVLNYYELVDENGEMTEFAEVEAFDDVLSDGDKRATRKLKIGAKLKIKDLIEAQIKFVVEKCRKDMSRLAASGHMSKLAAAGNGSQLAAAGNGSQLAAAGDMSKLAASGHMSKLAASGYMSKLAAAGNGSQLAAAGDMSKLAAAGNGSQLAAAGDMSKLAASGYMSKLAAAGNGSQLAAAGNMSKLAAAGDMSKLAAAGDMSKLAASGENSVLMACGRDSIAKANSGWITLAEWDKIDNKYVPVCVRSGHVGDDLRPDTWYRLENGEFVEAGE